MRRALLKSLASSFFMSGRITTTEAKAKELRPFAEKLITKAKTPTASNRRLIAGALSREGAKRIFEEAKNFADRSGGYTRIVKLGVRKSDSSKIATIELVK